jgi:hypothetical protein
VFAHQLRGLPAASTPALPGGFPAEMATYFTFARTRGWPPEVVRRLRLPELFWLPLMDEAAAAAAEMVQD